MNTIKSQRLSRSIYGKAFGLYAWGSQRLPAVASTYVYLLRKEIWVGWTPGDENLVTHGTKKRRNRTKDVERRNERRNESRRRFWYSCHRNAIRQTRLYTRLTGHCRFIRACQSRFIRLQLIALLPHSRNYAWVYMYRNYARSDQASRYLASR